MSDAPNVLILYVDQLRGDTLGCAGHPDVKTPHLDALAAGGTRFARCHVQNPVCMPSRVSFLTGRYPSNLGITHMGVPVPEDTEHLATLLGRAGYATANIGKLHFLPHANRDHRLPHPRYGFDHLEISDEPGPYDDAYRAFVRRTMPDQLEAISRHVDPPAAINWRQVVDLKDGIRHPDVWQPWTATAFSGADDATHTAFVGQRTIDYLRRRTHAAEPFFCISGFYNPHSPLVTPRRFLDLYDPSTFTLADYPPEVRAEAEAAGFTDAHRRQMAHGYYAMTSEVDHWVGRVLTTLDDAGLADDTVVVFTSDHGEFLGEHLRLGKSYPAPDCVSRVPLLVRGPGVAAGGVCDDVVEALDVAPTLLEACGVSVPPFIDGTPLTTALRGGSATPKAALLEDNQTGPGPYRSLRDRRFQYLLHHDGREVLHDLDAEHGAYRDVGGEPDYRDDLLRLRLQMATRLLNVPNPRPRVWCY